MAAYADKDQLIADYIPDAKSEAELAAVGRILDNVSAFVDSYCRRVPGYFDPSPTEPSEKRVRGEGEHFLRLPVHVFGTVESVTHRGTEIDSTNYYESDKNGWLYLEDDISSFSPDTGFFGASPWCDGSTYKVTARWGYDETPKDLQEAVRETVVRIWEAQKGVLGDVTPNGFVIERAMPLFAREVLDRYKRREFEI
jgi:hypothetical protein